MDGRQNAWAWPRGSKERRQLAPVVPSATPTNRRTPRPVSRPRPWCDPTRRAAPPTDHQPSRDLSIPQGHHPTSLSPPHRCPARDT